MAASQLQGRGGLTVYLSVEHPSLQRLIVKVLGSKFRLSFDEPSDEDGFGIC